VGSCVEITRRAAVDPFLSDYSPLRTGWDKISLLDWRTELKSMSANQARLVRESSDLYYLAYGDSLYKFERNKKEEMGNAETQTDGHYYAWDVTRHRLDFEFARLRFDSPFLIERSGELQTFHVDEKVLANFVLPTKVGEKRLETHFDPDSIFKNLEAPPARKIMIPPSRWRILESFEKMPFYGKVAAGLVILGPIALLDVGAAHIIGHSFDLWGNINFLVSKSFQMPVALSAPLLALGWIGSFFTMIYAANKNMELQTNDFQKLRDNWRKSHAEKAGDSLFNLLPKTFRDINERTYSFLIVSSTGADGKSMKWPIFWDRSKWNLNPAEMRDQIEWNWVNYVVEGGGEISVTGRLDSNEKFSLKKLKIHDDAPELELNGVQNMDIQSFLLVVSNLLNHPNIKPRSDFELRAESPHFKDIKFDFGSR
jgi:hypothetical protein